MLKKKEKKRGGGGGGGGETYPRGTSNDASKQIIVCYRLTIDCCFKISA